MAHPHTAHAIATLVEESSAEWGIPKEKSLTIITDNGSNVVAAFRHNDEEGMDSEDSADVSYFHNRAKAAEMFGKRYLKFSAMCDTSVLPLLPASAFFFWTRNVRGDDAD